MTLIPLTDTQQKIYSFIENSILRNKIPPSIKEISLYSGLSSSSSVHYQLQALEKKGYIKRDKTKSRSIKLTKINKKKHPPEEYGHQIENNGAMGSDQSLKESQNSNGHLPNATEEVTTRGQNETVSGYPLILFDQMLSPMCIDVWNLPLAFTDGSEAFLYEITDCELSDYGINKGDIALVEYNDTPPSGSIVMVIAEGRIYIRELECTDGYFILKTKNKGTISQKHQNLTFIGKIKSIMRKYI